MLADMNKILLILLLASAAGCAAAEPPVGRYRLAGEPDVASQLILKEDGRFAYMLAAGALDEHAEGRWTRDGNVVKLTTQPTPKGPEFTVVSAATTKEVPLKLRVTWPNGHGVAGVDLRVGFDNGEPVESYTQEYGWTLTGKEKRIPRWVEFAVPMHALASARIPIDVAKANDLTFVLVPNDLGVADFRDLRLDIGDKRLIMHRYGAELTYMAEE
jgi:hypothetical protein